MKLFEGSEEERQKHLKAIWEDQSKLLKGVQFLMKTGEEKSACVQRMIEASMWIRLYMEVENFKPDIKVGIATKEKQVQ